MANNLTIESPNFEKIEKESGQFTADAIALLWAALNDTRKVERSDFRVARDMVAPKVLTMNSLVIQHNVDTQDSSVIVWTGSNNIDITGFKAPETGKTRVLFILNIGTGTHTLVNNSGSSDTANRIFTADGSNAALLQNFGIILVYANNQWRQPLHVTP